MAYATAADGVRVHYAVTGRPSGPPVVLVQGLGADKHAWDLQRLAVGCTYHTIALDNAGAGRHGKTPGPPPPRGRLPLPHDRPPHPRRRPKRQTSRPLLTRPDGGRRDRRDGRRRDRD